MKNNSVFLDYFLKQDIKKRLLRTLLFVAGTLIALLILLLLQPDNTDLRILTIVLGGAFSILYLLGGIATVAMMVVEVVFIVIFHTASSPWNLLSLRAI